MKRVLILMFLFFDMSYLLASERSIDTSCTEGVYEKLFAISGDEDSPTHYAKFNINNATKKLNKEIELKAILLRKGRSLDYASVYCTETGALVKELLEIELQSHYVIISFINEDGWKISDIKIDDDKKVLAEFLEKQKNIEREIKLNLIHKSK